MKKSTGQGDYLTASKSRKSVQEQKGSTLEVANGHQVARLVDLEPVAAIPVSTLLNHAVQGDFRSSSWKGDNPKKRE